MTARPEAPPPAPVGLAGAPGLARWEATAFGPSSSWSTELQIAAGICLAHPIPCALFWGEQAYFFYNEELGRGLGVRDPGALGAPLYEAMPECWPTLGPMLHETLRTGHPFAGRRFPLRLDIGAGTRVRFVDLCCIPVLGGSAVAGVLLPIVDSTRHHLRDRQREAARRIATIPPGLPFADVAGEAVRHLVVADDVRFAAVFTPTGPGGRPVRVATAGGPLRSRAARAAIDVAVDCDRWPVAAVLAEPGAPVRASEQAPQADRARPSWETAWLAPLLPPAGRDAAPLGVLAIGFDERVETDDAPDGRVCRLAAAVGERLAR